MPSLGPTAAVDEEIKSMTIKGSSSLSMDAEGLIVIVIPPTERTSTVRFLDEGNGCNAFKNEPSGEKFCNYFQSSKALFQVAKHVDDWCRVAKAGFGKIFVDLPEWYIGEHPEDSQSIVACRELIIHSDDEKSIKFWMNRVVGGPKSLVVKPEMNPVFRKLNYPANLSREFAKMPFFQLPNLQELVIMHWVPFTDAEFLSLRIPFFEIMSGTISEHALNQYLHLWVSGVLRGSERFGVSFEHPIDRATVLRDLLVVPWDETLAEALPEYYKDKMYGETRYTVFRKAVERVDGEGVDGGKDGGEDGECTIGTICFTNDDSWYFDVGKVNKKHEAEVNASQRERAVAN